MVKKKAQAALEFLMTYGWAILVVLVVIGALAYFGILNPSILLPEKCTLQMGLYCKDHRVDAENGKINLKLENGMGKDIIITSIEIEGDVLPGGCYTGLGNYTNLTSGPLNCDENACIECSTWPGAATNLYYLCNPHFTTKEDGTPYFDVENYNFKVGMRIPQGRERDIMVNCSFAPLSWTGKTKNNIKIEWYYADSSPLYSHTMDGEILARVEGME
ncbi:hypothetical protein HQ529_04295 [Candidatus Woesearchaeota archaeon]|nr:hypothetical protein [Candidatus Woesearchaeota archaeon]